MRKPTSGRAYSSWDALRVDGATVPYHLERNRLEIPAGQAPGGPAAGWRSRWIFRLQPQAITDGLRSYRGFFGYSSRQLNLGHFLPSVAPRLGDAWLIHEPIGIGEQIVL